MASVLRNRGAGSGGFSGVYAPAFVPGSSHASADYIPGLSFSFGPVFGIANPPHPRCIRQDGQSVCGLAWSTGLVGRAPLFQEQREEDWSRFVCPSWIVY